MDGHQDAQTRVSNPALSWLRNVCIAVMRRNLLDQELSASAIAELCENEDVELPGLRTPAEDDQACKHSGKLLARCYKASDDPHRIVIDDFEVHKTEVEERDEVQRHNRIVRRYRFLRTVRSEPAKSTESSRFHKSTDISAHTAQDETANAENIRESWNQRV
jgi:hypothetical protein